MNKVLVCVSCLGMTVVTGCAYADEVRDVAPFTQLVMGGNYAIEVREGLEQLVVLKGRLKDLAHIETEVRGGTLYIEKERNADPRRVDVAVDVETLQSLSIGGKAVGRVSGIDGHDFDLSLAGSVDMQVAGTCGDAVIETAGSVALDARELVCERVQLAIAGSGDVAVHATEEVNMSIAGSGRVDVHGNPARVIPGKFSGSASVTLK